MTSLIRSYLDTVQFYDSEAERISGDTTYLDEATSTNSQGEVQVKREALREEFLNIQQKLWESNVAWMVCSALDYIGYSLTGAYTKFDSALVLRAQPLKPLPKEGISQKDFNQAKQKLDPKKLPSPENFKLGVGTCEYQLSGFENCPNSQWRAHELNYTDKAHQSNRATNHWQIPVAEEVARIKALGVNAYRFSVEWSLIEPTKGEINIQALNRYEELCDALIKEGIEPCITLHHFSHPQWFEDLGAFENEENIAHFVSFSKVMYERLGDRVQTWFTINEPNIYAALGYHGLFDKFPPGRILRIGTMMKVLANLFKAHDEVYEMIHGLHASSSDKYSEPKIGFIHQMLRFKAKSWFDPIRLFGSYMDYIFCHNKVMHFARTGEFSFSFPGFGSVRYVSPKGPKSDFIGINYYTVPLMQSSTEPMAKEEGEEFTDMDFRTHPTGLYLGLREAHTIGKPLMVTENGIADSRDDRRAKFIRENLLAAQKAVESHVNLKGYFYWSLMDNSEWRHGTGLKNFGLYAVNWNTFERKLREGAEAFVSFAKSWSFVPTPELPKAEKLEPDDVDTELQTA
jgi:beta-glucosidase